jgi:fused signal recognition particle receptor
MWTNVKDRFKQALERTSKGIKNGWVSLFQGKSLQDVDWDQLEETLLAADVGIVMTNQILNTLRQYRGEMPDVSAYLIDYMTTLMKPFEGVLVPAPVVLLVGVNGSGKTTTLGKLAALWHDQGERVHIVAGDTFRAGATEQLAVWAKDLPMTLGQGDPASVVYQGLMRAKEANDTLVLIDTAGRLPHQVGLMDQVKKIYGVVQRLRPQERCAVIVTLDATVGQHALAQIEQFQKYVPLTGIIVNKLDGTAKGGVLLNICQRFQLPIYGLGVGEKSDDFQPFSASVYINALWGNG